MARGGTGRQVKCAIYQAAPPYSIALSVSRLCMPERDGVCICTEGRGAGHALKQAHGSTQISHFDVISQFPSSAKHRLRTMHQYSNYSTGRPGTCRPQNAVWLMQCG